MATTQKFESLQLVAGADLNTGDGTGTQYKAAAVGGTIAATGNTALGLIQNKPKNGEDLTIAYRGIMKGVAGGAVAAGARVMVTTSGYLITAAGAVIPCGKAISAASSGATVEIMGDFSLTGVSSGP